MQTVIMWSMTVFPNTSNAKGKAKWVISESKAKVLFLVSSREKAVSQKKS